MARAVGGGVEYWIGLPVRDLADNMKELLDQLEQEREAAETAKGARG